MRTGGDVFELLSAGGGGTGMTALAKAMWIQKTGNAETRGRVFPFISDPPLLQVDLM